MGADERAGAELRPEMARNRGEAGPRPLNGASTAPLQVPARPQLRRNLDNAWVAGVSAGIAEHLGWPVWLVRLTFVVLSLFQFVGLVLYGALWVLIPERMGPALAPGLEAAGRLNMRPTQPSKKRRTVGTALAVVVLGLGIVLLAESVGFGIEGPAFWPILLGSAGVALVWSQADVSSAESEPVRSTPVWLRPLVRRERWAATLRVVVGMTLVGTALSIVAANQDWVGAIALPAVLAIASLTVLGIGVMGAPWVHRYRENLEKAREEKLLADARADMAAHLHDSVLQTLALIQRQADDPKTVSTLARRQERELRAWLYGAQSGPSTLKSALTRAAAEIEDERGVPINVICVGDSPLNESLDALVKSAREAMMNAAKHSGAASIDVYAEVEDDQIAVFVRDRGKGFDMEAIASDRMGVRGSIIGRMERRGGRATIRSAPGEGTEVRLEMSI